MKKITSVLIAILIIICAVSPCFAASASINVTTVGGSRGSKVMLPITISGNPGFASAQMEIHYDPSALQLVEIHEGLFSGAGNIEYDVATGFINHGSATNISDDGVVCTAVFKILDSAP